MLPAATTLLRFFSPSGLSFSKHLGHAKMVVVGRYMLKGELRPGVQTLASFDMCPSVYRQLLPESLQVLRDFETSSLNALYVDPSVLAYLDQGVLHLEPTGRPYHSTMMEPFQDVLLAPGRALGLPVETSMHERLRAHAWTDQEGLGALPEHPHSLLETPTVFFKDGDWSAYYAPASPLGFMVGRS